MSDVIRLSGKEIPGLAARVFASAFMPSGALGAAAEAVEFLEITGADGLRLLDCEKEQLLEMLWHPPAIVEEDAHRTVFDASRSPALFYCAVVADFLAAMVAANGHSAAISVRGGQMVRYLATVPYFLSSRGLSGLVVELSADETATLSASQSHNASWRYARLSGVPVEAIVLPDGFTPDLANGASISLFAFAEPPNDLPPFSLEASGRFEISSVEYAKIKSGILHDGWMISADLWSSLMQFADRSLIKTSAHSRRGAG